MVINKFVGLQAAKVLQSRLHFGFLQGLQIHQIAGQGYLLRFAAFARNIIMLGVETVELADEGLPYAGALLIDGILGRIGYVPDALLDGGLYHPVADLFVDVQQFSVIVI